MKNMDIHQNVIPVNQRNAAVDANLFEILLKHTSDIVIYLDKNFQILQFNNIAESFFNLKSEEMIGKNYLSFCKDKAYQPPFDKNFFNNPIRIEIIQDLKNGHHKLCTINWYICPITTPSNANEGVMLIGKNATLKRNNIAFYLDQIVACTPGSLYWKDRNGRYLGCNEFMARKSCLNFASDIIGKTDFDLWPDNAPEITKNDQDVIASGTTMYIEETVQIPNSQQLAIFTSVKMPLRDENNHIVGVIGNSLDITQLKETEIQLREAKEKADIANRVKTEFIRNMEHDIRTPFNGIWGLANILWQTESDPQKKDLLGDITCSAKELMDYCDGILDFSRIEDGAFPLIAKKFDLITLINSITTIETPPARHKKIEFTMQHSPNIPRNLIGDENRLRRILLNIISNAIKFTKEGAITFSIVLAKKFERKVIIKFIVNDTGIGIPQDKLNYIYEKFSKVIESNKGTYKGIGVGLRVVKQFIEEMDGEIDVKSSMNVGTQFTCIIPFKLPLLEESE